MSTRLLIQDKKTDCVYFKNICILIVIILRCSSCRKTIPEHNKGPSIAKFAMLHDLIISPNVYDITFH